MKNAKYKCDLLIFYPYVHKLSLCLFANDVMNIKKICEPKNVERKFAMSMNELKMIITCVTRLSKRHPKM